MNFPRVSFHVAQSRTLPPSQGLVNSVNITIETKACEVLENPTTGHRILTGRSRPVSPTVLTNINLRSSSPSDILLQLIRDQHLRFLYWHDNSHLRLYSYLALEISKAAIELGFGRNGFVMDIFYNVTYRTVVVSSDSLPRDESLSLKDLLLRMIDLGSDRFREETKSLKMETEPCSICLDDLVSGGSNSKHGVPTRMTCSHVFHDGCLLEWLERKNTCPLCRTVLYN